MNDADYIVFQGTGIPARDGEWHDRSGIQPGTVNFADVDGGIHSVEVYPTGMIDVREDGAVAEIWAPKEWRVSE